MPLQKFLNLLALMTGTTGVLLVSKAAYTTPKKILQATFHHSPISYPSNEIIASMASPKANVSISVVTLVIAFAIQFVSMIFIDKGTPFLKSTLHGLLLAMAFATVVSLILFFAHQRIYRQTIEQVKRLETTDYLQRGLIKEIERPASRPTELKVKSNGLEHIARTYFGIERGKAESPGNFLRRVAGLIRLKLSENLNIDELDNLDES